MKRFIVVVVVALSVAWAGPVHAAFSGAYRCTGTVGPNGSYHAFYSVIHYNPTGVTQTIRRIRLYTSNGVLYYDTGAIVMNVAPRGSRGFDIPQDNLGIDDVQVIVWWTQPVDTALPIPKTEVTWFNELTSDISVDRATCP